MKGQHMGKRITLPVLPMRDTVVFPGVAVPISAGRPGTIEAIEKALQSDRRLFAVCQRENVDDVAAENLFEMGVIVRILQVQRPPAGFQLLIQGEERARALTYHTVGNSMLQAEAWIVEDEEAHDGSDAAFIALDRELRDRAAELGRQRGMSPEALSQIRRGVEDSGAFADLVAFYLEMPSAEKQALLELFPVSERMRRVLVGVERDLLRIEAQQEIQQKVQEELGDRQREMMLREQMKAIQKELGEADEAGDLEELKERIAKLELNEEARKEIDRELSRLERTNPQSAEYQVIRTYLDYVIELPWNERTDDKIVLAESEKILEEDHYGLEDVKDRVLEFLSVRKLQMVQAAEDAAADAALEAETAAATPADPAVISDEPVAEKVEAAKAKAMGRGPILLFV